MRHIAHILAGWVVVGAAAALTAAAAHADGDPASDVLISQRAFVPRDAASGAGRVERAVAAAAATGYPLRVAVIVAPSDLGAVTILWRRPRAYARFLQLELPTSQRVLVVMPNGYGLYPATDAQALALSRLAVAGSAARLPGAAVGAVAAMAAAAGHPLPAAALTAPAAAAAGTRPGSALPWLVFAAGWVLIAAAWTASLRARALRARPGRRSPLRGGPA